MLIPPRRINEVRGIVAWVMRAAGLLLMVTGVYLVAKRTLFGVVASDFESMLTTWMEVGEEHSFYRGVAMLLVGAPLAWFAAPLARWIVTVPPETCPRCGHPRTPGAGGACTECGLEGVNEQSRSAPS